MQLVFPYEVFSFYQNSLEQEICTNIIWHSVAGCVTRQQKLKGYLYKDEKTNKVEVHETLEEFPEHLKKDALAIETVYEPVAATKQATL